MLLLGRPFSFAVEPEPNRVLDIFEISYPFEIVGSIIHLVAILVIHLRLSIHSGDEVESYKPVYAVIFTTLTLPQRNC